MNLTNEFQTIRDWAEEKVIKCVMQIPTGGIDVVTDKGFIRLSNRNILSKKYLIDLLFKDNECYDSIMDILEETNFFYPTHITVGVDKFNTNSMEELKILLTKQNTQDED